MTEITVRPMATSGLDPLIAATLIAQSGDVDLREITAVMDLRRLESYLHEQHQFHITIAKDTNGAPLGVAIMTPIDVFEGCCHFVEIKLDLYVPGSEATVYRALLDDAVTQARNEGARYTYIPSPTQVVKEAYADRLLIEETLVLP